MTAAHTRGRRCPADQIEAALHLLRTGRPGMALVVLECVPDLIGEALAEAYEARPRRRCEGRQDGGEEG